MAETLMLPLVNVQGAQIQLFSAGQSIPVAKAIPQLEQVTEAVCAMELRPKSLKLLAYRPGYGCLTKGQLENMHIVHEANKQFILVKKTTAWVETVEWTVKDLCAPFDDTNAVTKSEYKSYIETLNLGVNKFENEEVEGYKLLDFRENLWLHSTSIMMALLTMRDQYSRVGSNWVAFMIAKNTKICHTFDPLQSERNYASIERSVRKVMEPVLDLEGKLDYKKIDWLQPYLRMRYLYEAEAHQVVYIPSPTWTRSNSSSSERRELWNPLSFLEKEGFETQENFTQFQVDNGYTSLRDFLDKAKYKLALSYLNCHESITDQTFKLDYSGCGDSCILYWYWLGARYLKGSYSWQVYKECILLYSGSGAPEADNGGSQTASSSSTTETPTTTEAQTTELPDTPATEVTQTQAPSTDVGSTPTPATTEKCNAPRRRVRA
uniref:Uncharacterized protein n=1 Tax=Phytophthora ramorum TaxID=164328 RepID=H3GPJ0_PHYRM